jgi:protein-L-isoaspartate(D-aspartate) O-methyltransferase
MIDFAAARRMMVDGQVRTADVTDLRLLAAMLDMPRERFFPEDRQSLTYLDVDAVVSETGQPVRRTLKPMVLGKLIQAAGVVETDRLLDIGCATGYSTALLSRLAASVVALEQDAGLARRATEALNALGISNAKVVVGPLARGWPEEGPYDVIVVQGAVENLPQALIQQLANGGRLACVLGSGPAAKAMLYRMSDGEFSGRPVFDAAAPALPGFSKPLEFVF